MILIYIAAALFILYFVKEFVGGMVDRYDHDHPMAWQFYCARELQVRELKKAQAAGVDVSRELAVYKKHMRDPKQLRLELERLHPELAPPKTEDPIMAWKRIQREQKEKAHERERQDLQRRIDATTEWYRSHGARGRRPSGY